MAFTWTQNKIKFFKDASAYTGFHKQVGDVLKSHLDSDWSLCDLGCGLGLLDFAVASYVKKIKAVDLSEMAINDYKSRLSGSDIKNIDVALGDVDILEFDSVDVVLLSFFGKPGEELDRIFSKAKKEVILITYEKPLSNHRGKIGEKGYRPTTADYETYIKDRGYKYKLIRKKMEFGQPFKCLREARTYFEEYSRESDPVRRGKLIQKNLEDVKPTESSQFPYFLSMKKDIGIIIVDVG